MKKIAIVFVLFGWLTCVPCAHAIMVCHDYVLYRLTCKDPRPVGTDFQQGEGLKTLRDYLKANHYVRYPMTTAISQPGNLDRAHKTLRPGDVLIIREDHSGYVNSSGLIDHFIQVEGTSTKDVKYDATSLPPHASLNGKLGGFFENETLRDFLSRPYRQSDMSLEVWRNQDVVPPVCKGK